MPSRPSKDRRQAENRARRQARAARAENANRPVPAPATEPIDAGTSSQARPRPTRPARGSFWGAVGGRTGRTSARPGFAAVRFAFIAAILAVLVTLFIEVKVDADGERMTTDEIEEAEDAGRELDTEPLYTTLDVSVGLVLVLPIVAAGLAMRSIDRPNRRRVVMVAMIVAAVAVLFSGLVFAMPVVVALGIAHFQIRKSEMLAAQAARPATGDPATGEVIDVGEVVDDDSPDDGTGIDDDATQRKD